MTIEHDGPDDPTGEAGNPEDHGKSTGQRTGPSRPGAERLAGKSNKAKRTRLERFLKARTAGDKYRIKTRIAREVIDPVKLQREPELQDKCFFSYRFMDSYERTQLFAHCLARALAVYGKRRGLVLFDKARPIAMESDRMFSALWAARQEMDARGLEYCRTALWIVENSSDSGHKYLPLPNQVFTQEAFDMVMDKWGTDGWWETAIFDAVEPQEPPEVEEPDPADEFAVAVRPHPADRPLDRRFAAVNCIGSPEQISAVDDLEAWVWHGKAGLPRHRLATLLHRAKLISVDEAVRRFGQEMVDAATPAPGYAVDDEALALDKPRAVPGCIGFGPVAGNVRCDACPAVKHCGTLSALVDGDLLAAYGSTDPRAVRKRESNRKHQAASRARKKRKADSGNPNPEGSSDS